MKTNEQKTEQQERRQRAQEILAQLTLEEKIGMIHGVQLFQSGGVERLGIPPLCMSDGPMGVRHEFFPDSWLTVGHSDDYVSYLPCNSALASTWNRELAKKTGSVLGEEARGRGKDVILAPGINIKRSPLCGRNFEYFSEDPYLTKELAAPFIQGVQQWDVAACVKHFAANNQETERLWVEIEVDERTLREIYLPAFYDAVTKGGAHSIMGAYNLIYGEHCCQSEYLLNDILRKEWGYDGVVISDWGAVHDTRKAVRSQLDLEMSVTSNFDEYWMADPLKKLVEAGEIPESLIDEKVRYLLELMMKLHMMDGKRKKGAYNTPQHRQAILETARESVVLLKNENGRLPLAEADCKKVLIVGENADRAHSGGGGSAEIKALYEITPLLGIRMLLGGNSEVTYVPGYMRDEKAQPEEGWQEMSLENGGGETKCAQTDERMNERRRALREEAVRLAAEYDQVIFVGGLDHEYDSEGLDRADMKLPYEQDALICELLEANPETVVVMVGGSSVEMGAWIDRAKAVVWSWYAGMEGGTALAEVLFGEVNPSGKLPETFYRTHLDCSAHAVGSFANGRTAAYTEGLFVGYRYNDTFDVAPQFCFGHGLSYTEFMYSRPSVRMESGTLVVECDVTNVGVRAGKETVQVYLAPRKRAEDRPVQELKGFVKIQLQPGETKRVCILTELLPQTDKSLTPESLHAAAEIRIGSSSRDIRLSL